jgi:Smg protein
MYEILVYLFENCERSDLLHDSGQVARKLSAAGFEESDISEALDWMEGLTPRIKPNLLPDLRQSFRAYSQIEVEKIGTAGRGLLIGLESAGILSPAARELAIDRALAAADNSLSVEQMKLIVLMVLWSEHAPFSQLIAEELLTDTGSRVPS